MSDAYYQPSEPRSVTSAWPYGLECEHEDELDRLYDIDDNAGRDPEVEGSLYFTLKQQPTSFAGGDVPDLEVASWTDEANVTWTCPVCGEKHEDNYTADDFRDDTDD